MSVNLHIGHVIEVKASRVTIELATTVEDLYRTYQSRKYTVGQIGSIVKVTAGDILIFGVVLSLKMVEIEDNKSAWTSDSKWLEIDLIGQGLKYGLEEDSFTFRRGVSTFPLPGHKAYICTTKELARLFLLPDEPHIRLGQVAQASSLSVFARVDALLGRHFAVLGTTGSGKSCAVASILHEIISSMPFGHMVVLDLHDEYAAAFRELSYQVDPTKIEIPHWFLNFEESVELFIGKTEFVATRQANILKDGILAAKESFARENGIEVPITPDTPVPYTIGALKNNIEVGAPNAAAQREPYEKILGKLRSLQQDRRLSFLVLEDDRVRDSLSEILSQILRCPTNNLPLTIINLAGVPSEVVDLMVSVLARVIFDFAVWAPSGKRMPIALLCEEAHRYIPKGQEAAFEPARRSLERIAKEGRKYGVGLGLISQRPAEVSDTVLAQCSTVFAMRITNETDQLFVQRMLPDNMRSMSGVLSSLRTGESLVVGEAVSMPTRFIFDKLDEASQPRSQDVVFSEHWCEERFDRSYVEEVVGAWRAQRRASTQ